MKRGVDRRNSGRGNAPYNPQNAYSTPPSTRSLGPRGTPSSSESGGRHRGGGRGRRGRGNASPSPYPQQQHPTRAPRGGGSAGNKSAFDRGRVFGVGQEAVRYEKEKKVFKVGPADGQRFKLAAFLRGLTRFVEYQIEQRAMQPRSALNYQSPAAAAATEEKEEYDISPSSAGISTPITLPLAPLGSVVEATNENGIIETEATNSHSGNGDINSTIQESSSAGIAAENNMTEVTSANALHPANKALEQSQDVDSNDKQRLLSSSPCRPWWNFSATGADTLSPESLPRNSVASEDEEAATRAAEAAAIGASAAAIGPIELSLRLERLDLTDVDVAMVAGWVESLSNGSSSRTVMTSSIVVRKLWLFGNRIGDDGAAAVARIISLGSITECHLSHNMITLAGAEKLLEAVNVVEESEAGGSCLWLRLEWNRISLAGLVGVLENLHSSRGLLADVPEAMRSDAAPPLPQLPNYLAAAKAQQELEQRSEQGPSSVNLSVKTAPGTPFTRSTRNQLKFVITNCHCRLPWLSSQFETPSEAAVLQTAKQLWKSSCSTSQRDISSIGVSGGPLLLVPDTSALLGMLGAEKSLTTATFFTLDWLMSLAEQDLFGRRLPDSEQVFIVVPASVATQLDALKAVPGAKGAVRWFMSKGIDDMGPAGFNFLTLLGAHEGEALVLEHSAEVTGSRDSYVGSKGQATDHRIVEVGLFFQQECLTAIDRKDGENEGGEKNQNQRLTPVILLTNDNGQANLAKTHGLPAVRMAELAAAEQDIMRAVQSGQPLTASVLRRALGGAAAAGLGTVAARSLQTEFSGAVACLEAATSALAAAQEREASAVSILKNESMSDAQKVSALAEIFILPLPPAPASSSSFSAEHQIPDPGSDTIGSGSVAAAQAEQSTQELIDGLQKRLDDWNSLVRSHQVASRVLKWSSSRGSS